MSAAPKPVTGSLKVKDTSKAPLTGAVYPLASARVTLGPVVSYVTVTALVEPMSVSLLPASSVTLSDFRLTLTVPATEGRMVAV